VRAKFIANIFCCYVFQLCGQVVYSADPVCEKWFERSIKKIQNDCELDCATFGTDMGTFHCPDACDDLCSKFKEKASSRPGRFLFYPGLTSAERKLVDQNPKEAITVFVQKTRAELSSSRNFPVQGFNDESDAFRHYIWAGLLTREIGPERAQLYLDAHEENPLQAPAERAMDLANNRGGILAAQRLLKNNKAFDLKSLEQNALDDLRARRLVVLNPGLSIPKEPL
jgi:hypothetical protein